ncbi:BolA family protein [Chromatium weissei]|nr:BolA family protein [Chromatium weissei]
MEIEAITQRIRAGIPDAEVQISGDDGSHFVALVISDAFENLSLIQRQRLVMDTVKAELASGELHALSLKTQTRAQAAAVNEK